MTDRHSLHSSTCQRLL